MMLCVVISQQTIEKENAIVASIAICQLDVLKIWNELGMKLWLHVGIFPLKTSCVSKTSTVMVVGYYLNKQVS